MCSTVNIKWNTNECSLFKIKNKYIVTEIIRIFLIQFYENDKIPGVDCVKLINYHPQK